MHNAKKAKKRRYLLFFFRYLQNKSYFCGCKLQRLEKRQLNNNQKKHYQRWQKL